MMQEFRISHEFATFIFLGLGAHGKRGCGSIVPSLWRKTTYRVLGLKIAGNPIDTYAISQRFIPAEGR